MRQTAQKAAWSPRHEGAARRVTGSAATNPPAGIDQEYTGVMRARLIANPVAGADAAPDWLPAINARLRERVGDLDIVLTTGPRDAAEAARDAAHRGYECLFVAGGDGTLNETLNGVAQVDGALARLTFGIVPMGTGNDFATAIGYPEDPQEALDALVRGNPRSFDLGRVNRRLFINVSAGGFIADVSDSIDPALKTFTGRLAYLIGGAKAIWNTAPFSCTLDGEDHSCMMFAVCNAPTIGGGRPIAPHARPDDGSLDVCLVSAMDLLEFIAMLRRVAEGNHLDHPAVEYFHVTSSDLRFDRTIKVNADGEVFEADRCQYTILPRAVRFIAP
jgi:diacylglycerol kinase (ATP)